jgi:hypothetical protein
MPPEWTGLLVHVMKSGEGIAEICVLRRCPVWTGIWKHVMNSTRCGTSRKLCYLKKSCLIFLRYFLTAKFYIKMITVEKTRFDSQLNNIKYIFHLKLKLKVIKSHGSVPTISYIRVTFNQYQHLLSFYRFFKVIMVRCIRPGKC